MVEKWEPLGQGFLFITMTLFGLILLAMIGHWLNVVLHGWPVPLPESCPCCGKIHEPKDDDE